MNSPRDAPIVKLVPMSEVKEKSALKRHLEHFQHNRAFEGEWQVGVIGAGSPGTQHIRVDLVRGRRGRVHIWPTSSLGPSAIAIGPGILDLDHRVRRIPVVFHFIGVCG